ncbi:MAG: carnitine dehydratase [Gammaproteobacteria bacterium]|mgnify:CR=1 FL=1|nr:carnitine dehydratase [Gammaproteobacteria bacterium]RPG25296.1 MAG: CoA transferase [Gammaproteobacteria bacterium TMED50]
MLRNPSQADDTMNDFVFSGLKVIDCATVIAAPVAAMILADFGADVIKIEPPGGDMLRRIRDVPGTVPGGEDYMWQMDGRNKRGLTLDLKSEDGIRILRELVSRCDVFITNQPYSVREKLGVTYEELAPLNHRMIYASLTAYGEVGDERARKGFDQLAYWARSGLMDLMRESGGLPQQGLSGMGDHPTGVALYAGIVTSLMQREKTGEGGLVHTSLLANGLWSCAAIAQGVMAGGDASFVRASREVPMAMMRVYQCADDRWLQLNMVRNLEEITQLLHAIGLTELLADERFGTGRDILLNREAFGDAIAEHLKAQSSTHWMAVFGSMGIEANLVAIVEEKPHDPQVLANNIATPPTDPEMGVPLLLNHPIKATNLAQVNAVRPPEPSEHSSQILKELGYPDAEINRLRNEGII